MDEPIKIYKANIPLKNFYRAYTGLSTTDTQQIMNVALSSWVATNDGLT